MARSTRGGPGEDAAPPPAAEPQTAQARMPVAAATRVEIATKAAAAPPPFMAPPQGAGAPRRFFIEGGPMAATRPNAALKVLLDPIARTSATRVYSGQARNWTR
jgi:hypothetical protein